MAFAKDNDKLVILGGAMGTTALNADGVKALATMPSLDELRAKLVGLIQAPATKIAQLVTAPAAKLARVFGAYANKRRGLKRLRRSIESVRTESKEDTNGRSCKRSSKTFRA